MFGHAHFSPSLRRPMEGHSSPVTWGVGQEPVGEGDIGAVLGDEHPRSQVERNACPGEKRQHDEADPDICDVEGEVLGEPSGHTAQDPIVGRPPEQSRLVLALLTRLDIHGTVLSLIVVSGALNTDQCTLYLRDVKSNAHISVQRSQICGKLSL